MANRFSPAATTMVVLAVASAAAMALNRGSQPSSLTQSSSLNELAARALARIDGEVKVPGLQADVRVIRDTWGVPHIYASSATDLFFAQGFVAAQDRLWQMEMWRRTADGRLAEVLGQPAVGRDRQARLLKYRGRFDDEEFENYHPDARRLMTAFVAGVNAFIASHGDRLPVEFVLTGIKPEPWTVETLLLRQVTFGDATGELQLARQVASLGAAAANRRRNPDPWDDLAIPNGLEVASIGEDVLAATRAGGGRDLPRPEILPGYRGLLSAPQLDHDARTALVEDHVKEPGSNNWVVSGALSTTGKPVVANDPHREVGNPSLRYIFHLNAPGWNVIGASEAPFIGIALGHNERIAWGLTIVGTDQHDVYVEEVNPASPNEVRWQDGWEPLHIVRETIAVRGGPAQTIALKFSRHGPIFFEDRAKNRAYALRSALHEPGTAPYLAGLRLSQVKNCREFLDAAMYWKSPSENLICGDVDGNISWQASALTPNRKGWVGRLPVPGTGAYEWQGFRQDLPRELNPARGFVATANHNIQPKTYSPPLMFKNADTRFERITRLEQMIVAGRPYSIEDHRRMQLDALSLRAAADVPLFKGWTSVTPAVDRARALVAEWDGVYRRESAAAAVYDAWRTMSAPADGDRTANDAPSPTQDIEARLVKALARLTSQQGPDPSQWRWGRMHTRAFAHPFVSAFDLPTVERPGGAGTVAADGASYREILDISNWDNSIATNTPGQSAQPGSPFYNNLLPLWTDDQYFPLAFSPKAVETHTRYTLVLRKP
jgi:penicillin amidase